MRYVTTALVVAVLILSVQLHTAKERIANRLGYMGTAFIMMSPYLLAYEGIGVMTYIIGGVLSIPQVWVAKQWNLVIVNFNLLIGYGMYLFGS